MKTKAQKKESIDALASVLPEASITLFTTFARAKEQGLSVAKMQELKRALRAKGGTYVVAKKTLIAKALEDLKYEGVDVFGMDGSTGLVVGTQDAYAVAKEAYLFAKANPTFKLFGAWYEGHSMTAEALMEMASLPSRMELIAQLLGMMKYPLSSLAVVLNQVAEKKA